MQPYDWCDPRCPDPCYCQGEITATLERTAAELARLRKQRNELIRAHPGTLRAIGQAAQLSPERVRQIRNGV